MSVRAREPREPIRERLKARFPLAYGLYFLARRPAHLRAVATSSFLRWVPPGHFYSAIPDGGQLKAGAPGGDECQGIDLRHVEQLALLEGLTAFVDPALCERGRRARGPSYDPANDYFFPEDAHVARAMQRRAPPRRIIEIGSGHSSALMLETAELFPGSTTAFTFVDPDPRRLLGLVSPLPPNSEVVAAPVQDLPLARFDTLEAGDWLFIDSSHVLKRGSDLCWLLFRAIPRLQRGVVIHFHDIYWPFEYPQRLVGQGIAWNEAYALRAFLQFNRDFEIVLWNSYVAQRAPDAAQRLGWQDGSRASSLWIRRV